MKRAIAVLIAIVLTACAEAALETQTAETPTANLSGGTYIGAQSVTLASATAGAVIHYTLDGTEPTSASAAYSGAVTINATATLKAIAVKDGLNPSAVLTAVYTITSDTQTAETPTATPSDGTYTAAQSVTLASTTAGAVIHYTLDGTEPTTASAVYSGAVNISATATLKAIAVKDGLNNSAVLTAVYTITSDTQTAETPTATPSGGSYTAAQSVTLATATAGAVIHYTLDGTEPTTASAVYSGAVTINATATLKAVAVKDGLNNSAVLTAVYTITLPEPEIQPAVLVIDGVTIVIPVPAEGIEVLNVSAVVSNGAVADFADPSGIVGGKTVNLSLGAPAGQNRINYAAISAIETAFKGKGASAVSSDTISGVIPVFETGLDTVGLDNDAITALISSKNVSAQTPEVKIVNDIKALYNGGNEIIRVQSPMVLTGTTLCSELTKIQADTGMIYADETLRFGSSKTHYRNITLADFMDVYNKCGFDLAGDNNFLPKPGFVYLGENYIDITDTAKSWDIYRFYERYHDKGKLANLSELHANHITVAGDSAAGLYGSDNLPSASFPYKVKGEVLSGMYAFAGFENLYESTGNLSLPSNLISTGLGEYKIRNFATVSQLVNNRLVASGACFFQYVPTNGGVGPSGSNTLAVKVMRAPLHGGVGGTYIDLRDLPFEEKVNLSGSGAGGEIAFPSVAMIKSIGDPGLVFPYAVGYANDNSGKTKLIGTYADGFEAKYASGRNTGIIGVLELQDWTEGTPPADKTAADFPADAKWTATDFNAALQ
jgi:hypothetical protein